MTLKQKTASGILWSFIDSFASQGIQLIAGIFLARILSPREFGLVGMITVFIAVSQSLIDSGFTSALIRKKDCTQTDYSTVFFFNLAASIFFFFVLFFSAGVISRFLAEPQLKELVQALSFGLLINSFGIIQRAILIKEINFKLYAKISIIASLASGTISILMALNGFGVWSLVGLTLGRFAFNSLFFWIFGKWKPLWIFSKDSFRELFGFGSKLMLSGLIDTAYRNIYYLVIGKYFSAIELGYYTKADQFQSFPSMNLNGVISRVTYSTLSSIQDDSVRLKKSYKKIIRSTTLLSFVLMMGLAAVAKPMVITLIGEKWLPSVAYLQLLCFVGMLYPLHAINLNILKVKGRSDLYLRVEIIKKTLAIPVIVIGVIYGINIMIWGMVINSLIAHFLNSYYSGRLLHYNISEQIKDILPAFLIAITISFIVFLFGSFLNLSPVLLLISQVLLGAILTFGICELIKISDYLYMKEMVFEKLRLRK